MRMYDAHVHVGVTDKIPWSNSIISSGDCFVNKMVIIPQISDSVSLTDLNQSLLDQPCDPLQFHKLLFFDHKNIPAFINMAEHGKGIWGLKFHPSFSQMTILDVRLTPLLEIAGHFDLPILIHCGRDPKSRIEYIISAAKIWPKITFVAAHLGGMVADLAVKALQHLELAHLPNIYLDTSGVQHLNLIRMAIDVMGEDRIMFGSDEPYCSRILSIAAIDCNRFPQHTLDKIFYKNAEIVYG